MNWKALVLLAVLAYASAVPAKTWKINGEPVADSPSAKSDGDFGASLHFTDKPDELFAAWGQPGAGVAFSETSQTVRGKPLVAVIFFTGCGADADGNCDATVAFTTVDPDGNRWGRPHEGELWVGKARPGEDELQLSVDNLGLVIEPGDPLGQYTVTAVITDRVDGREMVLKRSFTAVEGAAP